MNANKVMICRIDFDDDIPICSICWNVTTKKLARSPVFLKEINLIKSLRLNLSTNAPIRLTNIFLRST
jgi:hypothetical protein